MSWLIPDKKTLTKKAGNISYPTQLIIDGKYVDSVTGKTFETINPSTGMKLAEVAFAEKEDVNNAVKAARKAFDKGTWSNMSGRARGGILNKIADLIRDNTEKFAILESLDNGKPIIESQWAAPVTAEVFEYYAGWADKYHGEVIPLKSNNLNYVVHEPVGVIGAITPWNFPTTQPSFKVAPALAMGNSVILKPAEQTPLTALLLGELCMEAGVPEGVINVLPGLGEVTGAHLVSHPDVDAISFTGSTEVGKEIMRNASINLKKLSLECGGKSPNIVFEDADMDKAVTGAFVGMFYNQGHVCNAGSRLFLQDSIYEEFVDKLLEFAKSLIVGDPLDPETKMGPIISEEQLAKDLFYIESGKNAGANLAYGGNKISNLSGYFLEPTIFTDVDNNMEIAQEEIFGPVLSVIRFRDIDHVIELANQSPYGLAAGVWTQNITNAHTLARKLQCGTIWINIFGPFDIASPWTGYKQSGMKSTEWGRNILEFVTQVKSVWVGLS